MRDLKILIAGAGVAGLTCAGLLRRQGVQPHIMEKENHKDFNSTGYMLGLYPLPALEHQWPWIQRRP